QAEDGIRDYKVTGVQTCALPISVVWSPMSSARSLPTLLFSPGEDQELASYSKLIESWASRGYMVIGIGHPAFKDSKRFDLSDVRSEERRVGKECRCRVTRDH